VPVDSALSAAGRAASVIADAWARRRKRMPSMKNGAYGAKDASASQQLTSVGTTSFCGGGSPSRRMGSKTSSRSTRSTRSSTRPVEEYETDSQLSEILCLGRYHVAPRALQDDYVIEDEVLGVGGTGMVKLARSKEEQRSSDTGSGIPQRFAVKEAMVAGVKDEERQRMQSEVEIFLRLDHPHITRLYDVYESSEGLQLVMECMEGGDLFSRLETRRVFSEADAADTAYQILLALNYIHSHGIVHRDLKLENFMYDSAHGNHLKMIDFGFSRACSKHTRMCQPLGTVPYSAPEVLNRNYTSQCDLWSLGVIVYTLLAGHMPFPGATQIMMQRIKQGSYHMKHERWRSVSKEAKSFVKSLMQVDPDRRLSAPSALQHAWLGQRRMQSKKIEVHSGVINALRDFSYASDFRRCCMMLMAWCLSNEERAAVRQYFLALDRNKHGTIILPELQRAMQEAKHGTPEKEVRQMFDALDFNKDEEIQYSDFLAAMLNSRTELSDSLLYSAFKRFDADHSGYITVDNVRTVMGHSYCVNKAKALIKEADHTQDGQISYQEFVMYVTGENGKYKSVIAGGVGKDALHPDLDHAKPACCAIC